MVGGLFYRKSSNVAHISLQMNFLGANVLIFEGILAFHHQEVLDLLDLKVFVDTDPDIRLCRRYRFIYLRKYVKNM